MKIIAFSASSSKNSINKQLVKYATSLLEHADVEILDLNDFELPLYSEDIEKKLGQPTAAKKFIEKLNQADGLVISFAEHNGSYTASYKNLFDWASRIKHKVYEGKNAIFLSTSPGPGGASNVLALAENSAPHFGANLKGTVSVGNFYDVFDLENGIINDKKMDEKIQKIMQEFKVEQKL